MKLIRIVAVCVIMPAFMGMMCLPPHPWEIVEANPVPAKRLVQYAMPLKTEDPFEKSTRLLKKTVPGDIVGLMDKSIYIVRGVTNDVITLRGPELVISITISNISAGLEWVIGGNHSGETYNRFCNLYVRQLYTTVAKKGDAPSVPTPKSDVRPEKPEPPSQKKPEFTGERKLVHH